MGELCTGWAGSPTSLSCLILLSLQEEAKAAKEEGVPDEEGWVKVTRKGRKPGLPRTEAASLRVLEREKQKRARKELLNFYAWQHRETKRERECPSLFLPLPVSLVSHTAAQRASFFLQWMLRPAADEQLAEWLCKWPRQPLQRGPCQRLCLQGLLEYFA